MVMSISLATVFGGVIGYYLGSYQTQQFSEFTYTNYLPPDSIVSEQSTLLTQRNTTSVYQDTLAADFYRDAKSVYREQEQYRDRDIAGVTTSKQSLTVFRELLEICDCAEKLQGDGPFTVIAPTDTGFDKLDEEFLRTIFEGRDQDLAREIVEYHTIPGRYLLDDMTDEQVLTTVSNQTLVLRVENGLVFVNGNELQVADVITENGVMHTIDAVMIPPRVGDQI